HNEGVGAKYTRPAYRRPLKMIYAETYKTRSEAMKAEAAFKKLVRHKKETYLRENEVIFTYTKHINSDINIRVNTSVNIIKNIIKKRLKKKHHIIIENINNKKLNYDKKTLYSHYLKKETL